MLLYNKQKKNQNAKGNRILISVTVLDSAAPIRFVAYDDDLIASVIDTALKCYAREGRLPLLRSNFNEFLLYCPMVGRKALVVLFENMRCGCTKSREASSSRNRKNLEEDRPRWKRRNHEREK